MSRSTTRAVVLVLIVLALTVFAGEAAHELHYADAHPGAYGPAKVIALACGAGAVPSLAAGIALLALTPSGGRVRPIVLLLLIATAIALGVWLVTLTAGSSGTGGSLTDGGELAWRGAARRWAALIADISRVGRNGPQVLGAARA